MKKTLPEEIIPGLEGAPLDAVQLAKAQLQLEHDKFKLDRDRQEGFIKKNFPSIISAFISLAAIALSILQYYVSSNDSAITKANKDLHELEVKVKYSEFLMTNQSVLNDTSVVKKKTFLLLAKGIVPPSIYDSIQYFLINNSRSYDEAQAYRGEPSSMVLDSGRGPATIFIQFRGKENQIIAKEVAASLASNGFKVPGLPQLVNQPTDGDVRYFYKEDAVAARKIADEVTRLLASRHLTRQDGEKIVIETLNIGWTFHNQPRRQFELWLPETRRGRTM